MSEFAAPVVRFTVFYELQLKVMMNVLYDT